MKVKIVSVSEVDASGEFEVTYKIKNNGQVLYDNQVVRARSKDDFMGRIQSKVDELKQAIQEAKNLAISEEIEV